MRSYLTWLETESGKQPVLTATPVAKPVAEIKPVPVAKPVKQAAVTAQSPIVRSGKRHKKERPASPPTAVPVAQLEAQIDVELVPVDAVAVAQPARGFWSLNFRDLIWFGIGACAGTVITLLAYLIASRLSRPE
jgi:hypothetical protein